VTTHSFMLSGFVQVTKLMEFENFAADFNYCIENQINFDSKNSYKFDFGNFKS